MWFGESVTPITNWNSSALSPGHDDVAAVAAAGQGGAFERREVAVVLPAGSALRTYRVTDSTVQCSEQIWRAGRRFL